MAAIDRQLEEDEAKLDNILHKIMLSCEKIKIVAREIGTNIESDDMIKEKLILLSEAIYNLSKLADDITLDEEKLTRELESDVRSEINSAISKIKEVQEKFE